MRGVEKVIGQYCSLLRGQSASASDKLKLYLLPSQFRPSDHAYGPSYSIMAAAAIGGCFGWVSVSLHQTAPRYVASTRTVQTSLLRIASNGLACCITGFDTRPDKLDRGIFQWLV